jgi:hypothetical protein
MLSPDHTLHRPAAVAVRATCAPTAVATTELPCAAGGFHERLQGLAQEEALWLREIEWQGSRRWSS